MLLQQHYCDFYHYPNMQEIQYSVPRFVAQRQRQGFFFSVTWLRVSACTPVTSVVSYLPTGLVRCSVSPGISCGARKLARTSQIKKKKKSSTPMKSHLTTIDRYQKVTICIGRRLSYMLLFHGLD
jgi:hypothetical protein